MEEEEKKERLLDYIPENLRPKLIQEVQEHLEAEKKKKAALTSKQIDTISEQVADEIASRLI